MVFDARYMQYWSRFPADEPNWPQPLEYVPLLPPEDTNTAWTRPNEAASDASGNFWTKEPNHSGHNCIVIVGSDYQGRTWFNLCKEPWTGDNSFSQGTVTIPNVVDFLSGNQSGWDRASGEWRDFLTDLSGNNFPLDVIMADVESLGFGSTASLNLNESGVILKMDTETGVLNYIYTGGYTGAFPYTVFETGALRQSQIYGNRVGEQSQYMGWNLWALHKRAEAMNRVFFETAKEFYPNVLMSNYSNGSPEYGPNLEHKVTTENYTRAWSSRIGNCDSPVLYRANDTEDFTGVDEVLGAVGAAIGTDHEEHWVTPWINHPYSGTGELAVILNGTTGDYTGLLSTLQEDYKCKQIFVFAYAGPFNHYDSLPPGAIHS